MIRSSPGGVSGWIDTIGGGSLATIAVARLDLVFPSKALRPVAISYITAPNEKISARASAA